MATEMHIAEKPSVAREMAKAMCVIYQCNQNRVPNPGCPVHELRSGNTTYLISSVAGHLMSTDLAAKCKSWENFPFCDLFDSHKAPAITSVPPNSSSLEQGLTALARRATRLVLWLDCDREGEKICFEVMEVVRRTKPNIPVARARFSALTERDIRHALTNLVIPDHKLSDAVDVRQELDLRVGAAFTRFQTLVFRKFIFSDAEIARRQQAAQGRAAKKDIVSFGPCQFPCVGFVVARYLERNAFRPENFWSVQFEYQKAQFTWTRGNIYDRDVVANLVDDMISAATAADNNNNNNNPRPPQAAGGGGPPQLKAIIKNTTAKQSNHYPPPPLATVEMQKLASTHLRIPAEKCMNLAESLYHEGIISYPRTETDSYTFSDAELKDLARNLGVDANMPWAAAAVQLAANPSATYCRPRSGGHDDKAHPPIHPLKHCNNFADPDGDSKKRLYEMIVRHFLASMSPAAVGGQTVVLAEVGGVEEFRATGFALQTRGFLEVWPHDRWGNNDRVLPHFADRQEIVPEKFQVHEGQTAAPPLLTEAQLIGMMDSFGIGTDATIASHIKTVQDRGYVRCVNNVMEPTELGIALISIYDALQLGELWHPQLRAQTEMAMQDVVHGRAHKGQVVAAFCKLYLDRFRQLMAQVDTMVAVARQVYPNARQMPPGGDVGLDRYKFDAGGGGGGDDDDDDNDDSNNNGGAGGGGGGGGAAANSALLAAGGTVTIMNDCPNCKNLGSLVLAPSKKEGEAPYIRCSNFQCRMTCSLRKTTPMFAPTNARCRCGMKLFEFGMLHGVPLTGSDPGERMCPLCDHRVREIATWRTPTGGAAAAQAGDQQNARRANIPQQQQQQQLNAAFANGGFGGNNMVLTTRNNNNNGNNGNNNTNLPEYKAPAVASTRQTSRQALAAKKAREK